MVKLSKISLVKRLSFFQVIVILAVMGIFSITLSNLIIKRMEKRTEHDLQQQIALIVNMMSTYNSSLAENAHKLNTVFIAGFPGAFAVDPGVLVKSGDKQAPTLKSGSTVLNNDTSIVDRYSKMTNSVCAVFVKSGDDFIRISSSLQNADGSRTVGSVLDKGHPAYDFLIKGEGFAGKATVLGKDYMADYQPVKDSQGKTIAAIGTAVDFTDSLKSMKEQILKIKIGKTGYIFAMDAKPGKDQGTNMIHPTLTGKSFIDIKDAKGFEFIRDIINRKEGISRYFWINKAAGETNAREKIAAFGHLKEWDWIVAAGSYTDELNTEGVFLRNSMLAATVLVVVILVLLFVMMVHRWISKPLQKAVEVTDMLAAGDFRHISDIDTDSGKTDNEVEQLEKGIQRMANSLRGLLEKIHTASEEVSAAAERVNDNATRIATGAEEVAAQAGTVATAGEEMSATSGDIAQNCQYAAEGAQRAALSASNGAEVVEKTVAVMGQIAERVKNTASTVENLGMRSDQIGAIIGTIEDIADQTNLLALNAAIEAARAGEQGRGFAVVADEVRALAERTTNATREIGEMIKAIQNETKGAVAAMEQGVRQVETGTEEAGRSGQALRDILEQVNAVVTQVSQIATAAEEQTATTSEIANNMQQITNVVHQTSEGAHESALAAAQLSSNAESLRGLVGQFKL